MQAYRYTGIQVYRHTAMQVCRYIGIQVYRYRGIHVYMYTGMQVCRYIGMQVCRHTGILDLGGVVVVEDAVGIWCGGWRWYDGDTGWDQLGTRWARGVVLQVRPRRRARQCRRRLDDVMMLLMLTALIEQQPLQEDDRHDRHSQRVDVEDLSATTSSSLPQTVLTSDSVAVFKLRLKTFLFSQAFSSFSAH